MSVEPRIFFRVWKGLKIGPLGCFDLGEVTTIDGAEYVVTAVEPDGVAVVFPVAADERPQPNEHQSLRRVLDRLDSGSVQHGQCSATERQAQQMAARIRGNRKRHGLAPMDREEVPF